MIWSLLLPILMKLPGEIGGWFERKQEIEKIEAETKKQIALERQKLASVIAMAEAEKSVTLIKATSARFKYLTFALWFTPFILTIVYPPWGLAIFENMRLMLPWYAESVVYLMMVVWGAQISQPVVSGIFKGLRNFFNESRVYKITKQAAGNSSIDQKELFETIRSIMPNGKLSQKQVNKINEEL